MIEEDTARVWCDERGYRYIETSAKDDVNVTLLFQMACVIICEQDPDRWGVVEPAPKVPAEKKGCAVS